jgi:hypothetical protein
MRGQRSGASMAAIEIRSGHMPALPAAGDALRLTARRATMTMTLKMLE